MTARKNTELQDAGLYASRGEVIDAMPEIIRALIAEAKEGSCQHAKFLVEFASGPEETAPAGSDEESLAAMLLKELRSGDVEAQDAA